MGLERALEKPVVFAPDEPVSKAISEMYRKRKSEAVVMDNSGFLGLLEARDLAKRKIGNPKTAQVKSFMKKTNPLGPGFGIEDLMHAFLVEDYKSVPVNDEKGNVFLVTKLGLLKEIRGRNELKNRPASDVMAPPYCLDSKDPVGTAISMLRYLNISRLPIVDEENRIVGLVNAIDLLKADIDRSRASVGERSGDSINLSQDVLASSFMQKNVAKAAPDATLVQVIDSMIEKQTETVLIEKNGKLVGMVTPKMVFKLVGQKVGGVYVRISGLQEEDNFIKTLVDEQIRNEVGKLGKIVHIDYMVMHVDRHQKTGKRTKYSIKSTMSTRKGTFHANDFAWDITKAMRGVLSKFEKEIIKRKEKYRMAGG